jgi:hypothetical protein
MKPFCLITALLWAMVHPASAAVYRVTSTNDNTAAVTTAGHAGTAADPYLAPSLRSAVLAANSLPGSDTIVFDPTLNGIPITLTLIGNDDAALVGDLDVTGPLTIRGNGTNQTIIQAGPTPATGIDKVFSLNPLGALPGFAIVLSDLTIRHGRNANSYASYNGQGGAFDFDAGADGRGSLVVSNCALVNNATLDGDGGAVALFDGGSVAFVNTLIAGNSVTNTSGAFLTGGALFVGSSGFSSSLTLSNCVLSGNQVHGASLNGGGIFSFGSYNQAGATNALHACTIAGNAATYDGGGLCTAAPWLIDQGTIFSANTASHNGGGIWLNATNLVVRNCAIIGNTAVNAGGGLHQDSAGSGLAVSYSRIAGNAAGSGAALMAVAGTVAAQQNWWGTNNPAPLIAGAVTYAPWLTMNLTAAPASINAGSPTTLTASFLTNSALQYVSPTNLSALAGAPVTFLNPVGGTLSAAQPSVGAGGTATATFTASLAGAGSAEVRIDNAAATVPITVLVRALRLLWSGAVAALPPTLYVSAADRTPLTTNDLPHVHLYASTNVTAPAANWTLVANPWVVTNGLLRVNNLATNLPAIFYRTMVSP